MQISVPWGECPLIVHVFICVRACICVRLCVGICVCMCVCTYVYLCGGMCVRVLVCVFLCVFACVLVYIGHFLQGGKKVQIMSKNNYSWNFTVTKRCDFFKVSQLFWRASVPYSLKILSFWSQPIFLMKQFSPQSSIFCNFRGRFRALLELNVYSWAWTMLPIILEIVFRLFSFFLVPL